MRLIRRFPDWAPTRCVPTSGPLAAGKQLRENSQMELVGLVYVALGAFVILTTVALGLWNSRNPSREVLG